MSVTLASLARAVLPRLEPRSALSTSERLTLERAAEVLVAGGPHGVSPADVVRNVERFLVIGRSRRAWRVRVLLRLIEASSIPRYRRPFSRLTIAERRELVVREWVGGKRIGRICSKVKPLVVLGAYGDGAAAARLGYVPVHRRKRFLEHDVALRQTA